MAGTYSNILTPDGLAIRMGVGDRAILHKRGTHWVVIATHHNDAARQNSNNRFTQIQSENATTANWVNFGSNWGGIVLSNLGNAFRVANAIPAASGSKIAYMTTKPEGTLISVYVPQKSQADPLTAFEWEMADGAAAGGTVPAGYSRIRIPGTASIRTKNVDGLIMQFRMMSSRWVYCGSNRDTELVQEALDAMNAQNAGVWDATLPTNPAGGSNNWVWENVAVKVTPNGMVSLRGALWAQVFSGSPVWPAWVTTLPAQYRPPIEHTFPVAVYPRDESGDSKPGFVVHVKIQVDGKVMVQIPEPYTDPFLSEGITLADRRVYLNGLHWWNA